MGLIGLGADIYSNGFGQGALNYLGQNTNFGQDVNQIGNAYQQANGETQTPLIGQPIANNPVSTSQMPSKKDVINKYLQNQQIQTPDESQPQQQKSSGIGKLIGAAIL